MTLARFALMHIIATCLCFWFGTIVEDALEDYNHKLAELKKREINISLFSGISIFKKINFSKGVNKNDYKSHSNK